jgi:RNA recognition motif-containing protein
LAYGATQDLQREFFAKTGTLQSIDMIKDRYTGQMVGFTLATMTTQEEAGNNVNKFSGKAVDNLQLKVNIA